MDYISNLDADTVSCVVALVTAAFGYHSWRKKELRREEVLLWANEVIDALQSLQLICGVETSLLTKQDKTSRLQDIFFKTSVLVERGRLFFRNEVIDGHGAKKPTAYRGYRPKILDQIVIAHQIACEWEEADERKRGKMRVIAQDCVRQFVSLVQKEVGRSRTASRDTRAGGSGVDLYYLLASNATSTKIRGPRKATSRR